MKRKLSLFIKDKFWFLFESEKCEHCHGKLRRHGDHYFGGIVVEDTISGKKYRTAYVCNLCYILFNK